MFSLVCVILFRGDGEGGGGGGGSDLESPDPNSFPGPCTTWLREVRVDHESPDATSPLARSGLA